MAKAVYKIGSISLMIWMWIHIKFLCTPHEGKPMSTTTWFYILSLFQLTFSIISTNMFEPQKWTITFSTESSGSQHSSIIWMHSRPKTRPINWNRQSIPPDIWIRIKLQRILQTTYFHSQFYDYIQRFVVTKLFRRPCFRQWYFVTTFICYFYYNNY